MRNSFRNNRMMAMEMCMGSMCMMMCAQMKGSSPFLSD